MRPHPQYTVLPSPYLLSTLLHFCIANVNVFSVERSSTFRVPGGPASGGGTCVERGCADTALPGSAVRGICGIWRRGGAAELEAIGASEWGRGSDHPESHRYAPRPRASAARPSWAVRVWYVVVSYDVCLFGLAHRRPSVVCRAEDFFGRLAGMGSSFLRSSDSEVSWTGRNACCSFRLLLREMRLRVTRCPGFLGRDPTAFDAPPCRCAGRGTPAGFAVRSNASGNSTFDVHA